MTTSKKQKVVKKGWAVLDNGVIEQHADLEREYWIMPKKPKRKDYHPDFTFVPCTIHYSVPSKK